MIEISRLLRFADPQTAKLLSQATWGIEKESQRVTPSGDLALTDHPAAFGDKLANPRITTDFAESQLELITPPLGSIYEAYASLQQIHDDVEAVLTDELLWPLSMPPKLPSEEYIRIASFNDSPEGREKEAYRNDLARRYGKKMQMISGLHVNFSFPEELFAYIAAKSGHTGEFRALSDALYFAVTRNFLRYRWLLIYLFGASPAIDPTYDSILCDELEVIKQCCPACCCSKIGPYQQFATSLRVSRFGYSNMQRKPQIVSFDSLGEYMTSFRAQLGRTLKKESEFYSSIRLKPRQPMKGETQLDALERSGVNYLEVRILDLNPYERAGISLNQLHVIHLFLLFCLFEPSPPISDSEAKRINENHHLTSLFGRKPGLKLNSSDHEKKAIKQWAGEILDQIEPIARLLDASGHTAYWDALQEERAKVNDPNLLPSAVMQDEMADRKESFLQFGVRKAMENQMLQATRSV